MSGPAPVPTPTVSFLESETIGLVPAGCLVVAGLMVFVVQGLLGRTSRAAVPAE